MPKQYNQANASEWTYMVDIETLPEPRTFSFEADERQRADLARRFGILLIEEAKATVTVQKVGGGVLHAIGSVAASVTQACVLTLQPVSSRVEDNFEGWFADRSASALSFAKARSDREAKKGHMEVEIVEESVDPEPVIGGKIDLGELAAQYLSLALNPYPQAEGAAHEFKAEPVTGGDGADLRKSPFEALKDWKEKR